MGTDLAAPGRHWLVEHLSGDARARISFTLRREIAFTSVGNYTIGSHYATQQSPYADRALIETLALRPARGAEPPGSPLRIRMRDLRHRFLGEPAAMSFQRTYLRRMGGFAAHCPINWGWRPTGGVSPTGSALGMATMVGMLACAKGLDDGVLRLPLRWVGWPALHDFREARRWLRDDLRAFTLDLLGSRAVREAELFNWAALQPVLDAHFSGRRDHYETVTLALDVALAWRVFTAR